MYATWNRWVVALWVLTAALPFRARAAEIVVDSFGSIERWSLNADGGIPAHLTLDTDTVRSPGGAMRIVYTDAPPHWSNQVAAITVPPDAVELRLWLYKHSSSPLAAMHVWLLEPDADAWVVHVTVQGRSVGALAPGWHEVRLPVGGFSFQPRGPGTPRMPDADRILVGCNFGDTDVTIDDLTLITRDAEVPSVGPTTTGLEIRHGPKGSVVILRDDIPATPGASDPGRIGEVLAAAGWGVTYVTAGDLVQGDLLLGGRPDVLVLAYGPAFPAGAAEHIKGFLRAGGALFCTGGYAFDLPLGYVQGAWQHVASGLSAQEVSTIGERSEGQMNSRHGRAGDALQLSPDQLQIFDPQFLLRRASSVRAAPDQSIISSRLDEDIAVEGYSAVSTLGSNNPVFPRIWGRRIPLVQAFDALGRLRGTVGALVHNYDGPYAGSSWAVFGVTNRDLFTAEGAPLRDALPAIVEAVARPTYISRLKTDLACYRRGEEVTVRGELVVPRDGVRDAEVLVEIEGLAEPVACSVQPGASEDHWAFEWRLPNPQLDRDFYVVRADLRLDGRVVDTLRTAFVVWDEALLARGPRVAVDGSYLTTEGRWTVLAGTNQTGFMWFSEHEDPLVWDQDFRAMADHGVRILRILHFSPFSEGGYEGAPTNRPTGLANRPARLCRQTDAIVQLAQKHGIIIFLSLHDWMGVGLSDTDLAAQRDWNRFWSERYAGVPGIIYDIENEPTIGNPPDIPEIRSLYNRILEERYGNEAALAEAWGREELGGAWGDLPVQPAGDAWDSVAAHDLWRLRNAVYNRWVYANAEGILAGDPDALFTVGNLISNWHADKQVGAEHVNFTNTHFYGSLREFSEILKFSDRRWEGKPLSVGEFGAQEAHGQRIAGLDGARDNDSIRRFLWYGHYTFGLGGAFLANWSWKDFEGCVFPWGIRYLQDPVSKDVLLAFRAQALLFRRLEPTYRPPAVFVVQPDSHRFGGAFRALEGALRNTFRGLYHAGVPFGVLGEWDLSRLPAEARALVWPVPYCPSDSTFDMIEQFVRGGGALYLSGDVAFDEYRRPLRADRLTRLGLPDVEHVSPFEAAMPGELSAVTATVGAGRVFFVPYPVELRAPERLVEQYADFLAFAGIVAETPCSPPGQVFRVALADGGYADVLAHFGDAGQAVEIASPSHSMLLAPLECGLVAVDASGSIVAINVPSSLSRADGKRMVAGDAQVMAVSLTGEGLETTPAALVMPLAQGTSELAIMAGTSSAVIEVGEIRDGRWVPLRTEAAERGTAGYRLSFDEDSALSLLLVYAPGKREVAVRAVEGLAGLGDWRA